MLSSSFGTGEKSYAAETAVTQTVETTRTQAAETTSASESGTTANELNMVTGGAVDTTDLFTDRDLEQTADLSEAKTYTISGGQTIEITSEGVYVITGSASNASIIVEAGDEDKVALTKYS